MAGKAGVAYVEIKFNPGDLERMQLEAKANGKIIADDMSNAADKNGGFFRKFIAGFNDLGKGVQNTTDDFGKFISESSLANGPLTAFGSTISGIAPVLGAAATAASGFGAALLVLPALVAGATFVLVALLDTVTTLGAGLVALAGPLSVVGILLGALGGGFVLAGERALKGGGPFKDFAKTIKDLQKQFNGIISTLAQRFLPYFDRLAGAAKIALNYLGQIAKLPLRQAFESLSTKGIALFSKFIYGVANVLKKPFRLAIQIAFGSGGQNAQTAISSWWNSLTGYLFGYTKTHPALSPDGKWLGLTTTTVKGALDPILKWFERQDFTTTGERWSDEIIHGFLRSQGGKDLVKWAKATAAHAGHYAGAAFKATLSAELTGWFGPYFKSQWRNVSNPVGAAAQQAANLLKSHIGPAWDWIKQKATGIWDSIIGYIGSHVPHPHLSWDGVLSAAEGIWDKIVSYIENHIPHPTIHLSIPTPSLPSLPSWLHPHTGGIVGNGALHLAGGGIAAGGVTGIDSVPALLTPGEMVLNREQQLRMFRLLNGGGGAPPPPTVDVQVFVGNEPVDARVEVAMRRTGRRLQAGKKWSLA